jgi:hypothetical protein
MRAIFGFLVSTLTLIGLGYFTWVHLRHSADATEIHPAAIAEQVKQAENTYSDPMDAAQPVGMAGPLATYMSKQGAVAVEKVKVVEYKPTTSDHVGGSVVGTSIPILHDKFHISVIVDLPFQVPPHAATPKLRGTFRSFVPVSGKPTSDTDADLEFHVLNEQEYSSFLGAKPSEALFSADATHDEEVNASLPPTLNQPVNYHIVFVNESRKKKVVEAEFRLEF